MKKLLFIVTVLLFTALSCSKATLNEDSQLESNQLSQIKDLVSEKIPFNICPQGTHAVISFEFNEFRFKRPKYDCESGFWFCTTDGGWVINCVTNYSKAGDISNIDIVNKTTTVAVALYEGLSYVDFYFPKELA